LNQAVILIGNKGSFLSGAKRSLQPHLTTMVWEIDEYDRIEGEHAVDAWIEDLAHRSESCKITAVVYLGGETRVAERMRCENVYRLTAVASLALNRNAYFIYLSSLAIYDGYALSPVREIRATTPPKAVSLYGKTKVAGDKAVRELHAKGLKYGCLKPASIAGGARANSSIERVQKLAQSLRFIRYFNIDTQVSYTSRETIYDHIWRLVLCKPLQADLILSYNSTLSQIIWSEVGKPRFYIELAPILKVVRYIISKLPVKFRVALNSYVNRNCFLSQEPPSARIQLVTDE